MNDGHIPSAHYANIIQWYEDMFEMLTNQLELDSNMSSLIRSKKNILVVPALISEEKLSDPTSLAQ